jgi:hypothetical protein
MAHPLVAHKPLPLPPLTVTVFRRRQQPCLATEVPVAVLQAEEPLVDETTPVAPAFDATVPMAGSKRNACAVEDKKAKLTKKPLS